MNRLRTYLTRLQDSVLGHRPGATDDTAPAIPAILKRCLTNNFLIQAAVRQVPLDGIEVDVRGPLAPSEGALTPFPPLQYTVKINSPASDWELTELHAAVEEACPPLNRLTDQRQVSGEIVRITDTTVNSVTIGARASALAEARTALAV